MRGVLLKLNYFKRELNIPFRCLVHLVKNFEKVKKCGELKSSSP